MLKKKFFLIAALLLCSTKTFNNNTLEDIYFCFKEYCSPRKHMKVVPAEQNSIKNIIFDLNGVIFDTSKKYTSNNFAISFHIFSEDYFMESHFAYKLFLKMR